MIGILNCLFAAGVLFSGFFLYWVKNEARAKEVFLAELREDIARQNVALDVLRAEWSYLDRPDRLQKLAYRYLELQLVRTDQILGTKNIENWSQLAGLSASEAKILPPQGVEVRPFVQ